jgi:hypothetical protein
MRRLGGSGPKAEAMPTREHSRHRQTTIVGRILDGSVEPYSVLGKQYQPWRDLGRLGAINHAGSRFSGCERYRA